MAKSPWRTGVLAPKFVELVSLAVNVACTNLNGEGTRRHVRGAFDAGATRDESLLVFECASVMAIHSCSLGAPIVLEEAKAAGVPTKPASAVATPAVDKMKAIGQWNTAWEPFLAIDPGWTDAFMATGAGIYGSGVLPPKEVELLSIAFDASFTHMYAPGTRRHIQNALNSGRFGRGDFRGSQDLRIARRSGLQSRRPDPRGGTGCERGRRKARMIGTRASSRNRVAVL